MVSKSALISIHPEYADKILSGEKNLEFRRKWAVQPVDTLYIYATAPVQRIVGSASVKQVISGSKNCLWNLSKEKKGGISRRKLFTYLNGVETGVAIELGNTTQFSVNIDPILALRKDFRPPQSFRYLSPTEVNKIKKFASTTCSTSVFFVGGIHGVGKTICCTKVAQQIGWQCLTASTLIKNEKASAISGQSKHVHHISENQDLLISSLQKLMKSNNQPALLDGHFTLINKEGLISKVDIDVFQKLGLNGIAIFRDDPYKIGKRMNDRDEKTCDISQLKVHQETEIEHGQQIASYLGIPLILLDAFDTDGLANAIELHTHINQ